MTVPSLFNPYAAAARKPSKAGEAPSAGSTKGKPLSASNPQVRKPLPMQVQPKSVAATAITAKMKPSTGQSQSKRALASAATVSGGGITSAATLQPVQAKKQSLKEKLKNDIQNLKRAKLLKKKQAEEEKQRKLQEKQKRKLAAAATASSLAVANKKPHLSTTNVTNENSVPVAEQGMVAKPSAVVASKLPEAPMRVVPTEVGQIIGSSSAKSKSSLPAKTPPMLLPRSDTSVPHNINATMGTSYPAPPSGLQSETPTANLADNGNAAVAVASTDIATKQTLMDGSRQMQPHVSPMTSVPSGFPSNLPPASSASMAFHPAMMVPQAAGCPYPYAFPMNGGQFDPYPPNGYQPMGAMPNHMVPPYAYPPISIPTLAIQPPAPQLQPLYPAQSVLKPVAVVSTSKPEPPPLESIKVFSSNVLQAPSPFAHTHSLLPFTIQLVKKPGASFGVTIKELVDKSDLVDPSWIEAWQRRQIDISKVAPSSTQLKVPDSETSTTDATASKRIRRRRVLFSALVVVEPSEQNKRILSLCAASTKLLKPGDMLLTINGQQTAGRSFQEACSLFAACNKVGDDGWIRCAVAVARQKVSSIPRNTLVPNSSLLVSNNVADSKEYLIGPWTVREKDAFAMCMFHALFDNDRVLGSNISDDILHSFVKTTPALGQRQLATLKMLWTTSALAVEGDMTSKALEHWRTQWMMEPVEVRSNNSMEFLTDSQRSSLRAAPRPSKGCKCGKQDHEYVNDAKCPLYSDLRHFVEDSVNSTPSSSDAVASKLPSDLKVVEKAFVDRLVRLEAEKAAQEAEARFVARMEKIQGEKCSRAVLSPSLAVMILSTVIELQAEFQDDYEYHSSAVHSGKTDGLVATADTDISSSKKDKSCEEDSDDDEDVPLEALGKQEERPNKKQKTGLTILRPKFLARLLQSLSRKWGHVYTEASHSDYAWRWEVYHGQTSDTVRWDIGSKNPRLPGSQPFENIRFAIDDAVISNVESKDLKERAEALTVVLHLLSPSRTGLCDELESLIRMGVLNVDKRRLVPVLSAEWWANVDVLMLDDMNRNWGLVADPGGHSLVADILRSKLEREWRKTDNGWYLGKDIVYETAEFNTWRAAIDSKLRVQSDNVDGVERFGI